MKQNASYKDLLVWQKSVDLTERIYRLTEQFPDNEKFGLISQMRRASCSIASNIAEGKGRGSRKDFLQFLRIALGSVYELETQLIICQRLGLGINEDRESSLGATNEVARMLQGLISSLTSRTS